MVSVYLVHWLFLSRFNMESEEVWSSFGPSKLEKEVVKGLLGWNGFVGLACFGGFLCIVDILKESKGDFVVVGRFVFSTSNEFGSKVSILGSIS